MLGGESWSTAFRCVSNCTFQLCLTGSMNPVRGVKVAVSRATFRRRAYSHGVRVIVLLVSLLFAFLSFCRGSDRHPRHGAWNPLDTLCE